MGRVLHQSTQNVLKVTIKHRQVSVLDFLLLTATSEDGGCLQDSSV